MGTSSQESPAPTFGAHAGRLADGEEADAGQVTASPPAAAAPATPPAPSFSFSTSALTVLNEAGPEAPPAPPFTFSSSGVTELDPPRDPSYAVPSPTGILLTALAYGADRGGVGGYILTALNGRRSPQVDIGVLISRVVPRTPGSLSQVRLTTPQQADERAEWFTDPPLVALFGRAAGYAARTTGSPQIHVRHLVAAVVLGERLDPVPLADLGTTPDELPELLLDAVRTGAPTDDQSAWEVLLALRLAGGISREFVDPRFRITRADDDLRHGVWAGMFAAVMADAETPLPLSVGLFGAWGSCKSHFMGLLRSEIDALSGQPGYVSGVVHVRFNAWHYADANLWASLGDEIFRTLAEAAQPPGDTPPTLHEEAERLQQRIDSERAEAERYRRALDEARLRAEKHEAEIRQAQQRQPLTARQLAMAALRTDAVRSEVKQACDLLHISDKEEQAKAFTEQLADTKGDGLALRSLLRQPLSRAAVAVCLVALVIALAGTLIPLIPAGWGARLRDSGALASAAALLGFGSAALRRVTAGLAMLRSAADKAAKDNEDQTEQAVQGIRAQLEDAQQAERTAAERLTAASALVTRHERELGELMPGRQLYAFLAERAASGDYSGQLGLVSVIRKDLERLVMRLADQDIPGPWLRPADPGQAPRRIDRIVLYIDDLDRCRPRQVVEVLQAVHLLLALNLFVVVVCVDPHWLIRSLRDQYPDMLDGGHPARSADPDGELAAHPADYLEKIFNIPFTLPRFGEDGMADMANRLLSQLVVGGTGDGAGTLDGDGSAGGPAVTTSAGDPAAVTGSGTAAGDGQLRAEPGSIVATAGQPAATRRLTPNETGFLAKLGLFMRTPRDAKRLFNMYRMIRATRDLSSTSPQAFLGGEYQAVALLLAMVTLDAEVLRQVLDAPANPAAGVPGGLAARPGQGLDWGFFAIDLIPAAPDHVPGSELLSRNNIIGEIPGPDLPAWERMALAVEATSGLVTLQGLDAFQRWAPTVRRFSYALLTEGAG